MFKKQPLVMMNAEKWNIWPSGALNLAQSVCQKTSGDVPGCSSATDGTMQNSLGRSKTGYQFGDLWMFYDVKIDVLSLMRCFGRCFMFERWLSPPVLLGHRGSKLGEAAKARGGGMGFCLLSWFTTIGEFDYSWYRFQTNKQKINWKNHS